jgi:hypothetical protein
MYTLKVIVEGVRVFAEDLGYELLPLKEALNSAGEPIVAFYQRKVFPKHWLEVPGTKISFKEFNERWLENNHQSWSLTTIGGIPYLQITCDCSSRETLDSILKLVNEILAVTFGGDLDELYQKAIHAD